MPYIQRAITPILKQRVSTSKCMLLVGARQVGKSTLIKHEFKDFNRANFDDRLTRMQAKEEPKLFFLNNPQPLFIDDLCVDASTRGQHIGEKLFVHVKEEAKRLGCYEVTLNVWAGNTSAEKFYEKMGLKTKEQQMEYIL